jgi:hypothetical protein
MSPTGSRTANEPRVNPGMVGRRERKEVGLGRASTTDDVSPIIDK